MNIEVGCFCGKELKCDLEARHDFGLNCEDMKTTKVICPECGMKARVWIGVSVEDYGKDGSNE